MRSLDSINPEFLRPSKLMGISTFVLVALTLLGLPLADGAAPTVPVERNPIMLFILFVLGCSLLLPIVSLIFRWGWKAKNYGISFLSFSCVSYLGLIPCSTVVLYGSAPYWIRALVVLLYGISIFIWCRKFSRLYAKAFADEKLRSTLYEEEHDAVYYMRRGDEFILKHYFKFTQVPRDRYFILFILLAVSTIPLMSAVHSLIGLPFVHIFLLIAMVPICWMSIGFAVRGFLIFYFYPAKIKKATGKDVYVDLANKPRCEVIKMR